MVTVAGLVLVHIIPHSVATSGWPGIALAMLGFFGPGFVEHRLHRAARQAHTATLVLALVGLVVHAFFDGVALGAPLAGGGAHTSNLALAVVLHRLPIAITIWWLLRPSFGLLAAAGTLVGLGLATVGGYTAGDTMGVHMEAEWLGLFQTLIAGSLLHVVVHRPTPLAAPSTEGNGRLYAGIGALAGLGMVAYAADTHLPMQPAPHSLDYAQTFITLTLETAPALLLAFALAGMVQVFLPHVSLKWMRTGRPLGESMRGVVFGLPLPICSCGVIPLYQSLTMRAVPATAAMAFLIATPELGIDAILISLPLLGPEMTVARVVCAAVLALFIGWTVGSWAERRCPQTGEPPAQPAAVRGHLWGRLRTGLRFGFAEIVDHVGPWLIVGLAIASLAEPLLRSEWITHLPSGVDVVLFALIGIPAYVCASAATPLAAVLIHKGVSPGAALAFLLAGPATNITTFGVLAQLHGRRVALAFGAVIATSAIGLGMLINVFIGGTTGLSLHEASHEEPSLLAMGSLAVLSVAFALSVLRQGPRGFIGQVINPYKGDHDHDDGHGHDHGGDHGGGNDPADSSCGGCASI